MSSLRDQLIGAWELVEYQAYSPADRTNTMHPMGRDAQGIIMYTPDGYMSAQLQTPGVPDFALPGSDEQWAAVGRSYIAYTGRFWLDEEGDSQGPLLVHEMRNSNLPRLVGDRQRRLCEIREEEDGGRYLYLSVSAPMGVGGNGARVPLVRWRRMGENLDRREPARGD